MIVLQAMLETIQALLPKAAGPPPPAAAPEGAAGYGHTHKNIKAYGDSLIEFETNNICYSFKLY